MRTDLTIRPAAVSDLPRLTALFDYNDISAMIAEHTQRIESGEFSVFLLLAGEELIGELHVTWRGGDPQFVINGQRAYLSAFRIRQDQQGHGLGQRLLSGVLQAIAQRGYREVTIGVEDDNRTALHLYAKFGFTTWLARCRESYQGDCYEYDLYLKTLFTGGTP